MLILFLILMLRRLCVLKIMFLKVIVIRVVQTLKLQMRKWGIQESILQKFAVRKGMIHVLGIIKIFILYSLFLGIFTKLLGIQVVLASLDNIDLNKKSEF